jgi:hypothetical protein
MEYRWLTNTNSIDIVVARYNENMDWLLPLSDICTVYNKGDDMISDKYKKIYILENVGRESHTYLHHIIKNYDNLGKITLFTQANISDHIPKELPPLEYVSNLITSATIHGHSLNAYCHNVGSMSAHYDLKFADKWPKLDDTGMCFGEWLKKILPGQHNIPFGSIQWYKNGLFALDSNVIKRYPKEFYEKLAKYVDSHIDPEAGHYFERAWYEIFIGSYYNCE